jgi:transposase
MSNLSENCRLQIITLKQHANKSVRDIAALLNVSKSAVGRVIKSHQVTGTHQSQKFKCGRKRKTSLIDDRMLVRLSKKNPLASSSDLKSELSSRGVQLSDRTVRYRLVEAGRIARRPVKCQVLTPEMRKKRLEWALEHQNWTLDMWRSVRFILL